MIQLERFLGMMDLDSPDTVIPKGLHRTARNGLFRGVPGNYRFEVVPGTTQIPNPYLPGTGINKTIGRHYDPVSQRLFSWNYNSGGLHGIYVYYTVLKTWYIIVQDGNNTNGEVLGFNASVRITGLEILYGDGNSGDLLFYINSNLLPCKLNINRMIASYTAMPLWTGGTYSPIQSSFLQVIKPPPNFPPPCVYENDTTVTTNNLLNALLQVGESFIYDDFEESVMSTGSQLPLPSDPFDPTDNLPQTRNCRIRILLQTGDQNVDKIRIYGRQTKAGVTSGWFIIDTLIKAQLGIANNTIYEYLFYNNGSYVTADPKFTVIDQDFVPQQANCQSLLDGTTIAYSGITEGYPFLNPSLNITTGDALGPGLYSINGTLLYAATNGIFTGSQPQITVYLTGVGVNDGSGNPTDLEKAPSTLYVRAKSGATDVSFSYNNGAGNRNIATLLFDLRGAATSAGWVYVSNTTNSLTLYYPTGNVVLQASGTLGISASVSPYASPILAFYPESAYAFGVVYRDANGRTNGVISNVQGQIKTAAYNYTLGEIPVITINLSGFTPPSWAVTYDLVRTDTLTYQKHLYWVSNQAFDNLGQNASTQFAYLSITNMADYNINLDQAAVQGTTSNVVSYQFTAGDRLRVLGRYDVLGNFTQLSYDYAIIGTVVNPVISGVMQTGTFLQIQYPSADINANFSFAGGDSFQNYEFLIYSYQAYSADQQNVFFAVGEKYGIGNPGTNTAYHMGNTGDNIISLSDGDIFYRLRTVPVGNTYYVNVEQTSFSNQYATLNTVNDQGLIDNSSFQISQQVAASASPNYGTYPNLSDNKQIFYNKLGVASQIRLRSPEGGYSVTGDKALTHRLFVKVVTSSGASITYLLKVGYVAQANTIQSYTFFFDDYIPIPAGAKAWVIAENDSTSGVSNIFIGAFTMRLDVIRNVTVQIFESSFSDIYQIETNSDSQPNVININAQQTYFSTLFRFSEPYQLGTNINNSNRFYENNFDEFDKSFGDVNRMRVRGRECIIFQYRRIGHVGVYAKFIKDNQGINQLVTTDTIITPNNIQYYEGEYGIGNQPSSLASSGYRDYFVDPVKGYLLRLSLNGIEPISELFHVQTWAGATLPLYLQNYTYNYGGTAAIIGCYNVLPDRDGEMLMCVQPGNLGSSVIQGETIVFNEKENAFRGFRDYNPDDFICCENVLYSFQNGVLYSHDNTSVYGNFYGTQYPCTITFVLNGNLIEKKAFKSISQVGSQAWECPSIYTNQYSYGTTVQQSNLVAEDFAYLGSVYDASFWMDANGQDGIFGTEPLKGNLIAIQFQVTNPSNFVHLSQISVYQTDDRRTNR